MMTSATYIPFTTDPPFLQPVGNREPFSIEIFPYTFAWLDLPGD